MKLQSHWIEDISTILEDLSHGEKLTKFVSQSKTDVEGHPNVTIHGFITESGKFIIVSEQYDMEEPKGIS